MSFDAFAKIAGIPGESTDAAHVGWVEVISYSHSLSQPAAGDRTSSTAAAQRCCHGDFVITKTLDMASPKLALYCCTGQHIPEILIHLCRATGDKQVYMEIKLSDVVIAGIRPCATKGEELPVEEVAFNYAKIDWCYMKTDHETGKPLGSVKSMWDLKANRGA